MSRAVAYLRFKDGSIFHACYDGTSDVISPWLISREELYGRFDTIFDFDDYNWKNHGYDKYYSDLKDIDDSEDVEVYIDYGSGFCWEHCQASKSKMCITSDLSDYDNRDLSYIHKWAIEYMLSLGYDASYITRRIV